MRPALRIEHGGRGGIDAEAVVERGEHFLEFHRTIHRLIAVLVGRADDLTVAHAAAGEDR